MYFLASKQYAFWWPKSATQNSPPSPMRQNDNSFRLDSWGLLFVVIVRVKGTVKISF